MSHKRYVLLQICIGVLLIVIAGAGLWYLLPSLVNVDRNRVVFGSLGLICLSLVFSIQLMLLRRFNSSELIQGRTRHDEVSIREVFLSNTLEQVVLATVAILVAGFLVPAHMLKLPLICAIIFLVGRVLYYIGYSINPMNRFTGFVAGHYSSLALLATGLYYAAVGS